MWASKMLKRGHTFTAAASDDSRPAMAISDESASEMASLSGTLLVLEPEPS